MPGLTQLWPTGTPGRQYSIIPAGAPGIGYFQVDDQPFTFTAARWRGGVNFYLEVYLKAVSGTVYARLFEEGGAEIANSVVSTASTSFVRLLSSAISGSGDLTDGGVYRFQLGAAAGASGTVKGIPESKAR